MIHQQIYGDSLPVRQQESINEQNRHFWLYGASKPEEENKLYMIIDNKGNDFIIQNMLFKKGGGTLGAYAKGCILIQNFGDSFFGEMNK